MHRPTSLRATTAESLRRPARSIIVEWMQAEPRIGVDRVSNPLPLTLQRAHAVLGWPTPESVLEPPGAGASVFASLVRDKIGRTVRRLRDAGDARIGVLMADPNATTSEPPVAIVAEFQSDVGADTLRELHRLSWNFSHSPTVITIEPAVLRVWSCCEAPDPERPIDQYLVERLPAAHIDSEQTAGIEAGAARAVHWINLVSGQFFAEHANRFDRDGRADQTLLGNLRYIRKELATQGLQDDDTCHDLLARVIFVQFLFDRKDQDGNPALTESTLLLLQKKGLLENRHSSLPSVLSDYEDTYRLFDWLNAKFNGDLFPGKGDTREERAHGWAKEKRIVRPKHLSLLARFIGGNLDMPSRQMLLWPQYSFDVIPLEFISSIYETFVTDRASAEGIYYTPPYLVDFVLDRVLPWDGTEWDLKILDPACGSGIFLVKSFQRLVHRWRRAHPRKQIRADVLRGILERNLFGVDKDGHAVRVACFSLYLAMCDEIEPRHYWTQVTFPPMRDRRLVFSDFFNEHHVGFSTNDSDCVYDLVVGNAPFGADVITDDARSWAESDGRRWRIPNNDVGGLFLAKGAELTSSTGKVALIQSANTLLFNVGRAAQFRKQLFATYSVEAIYNLAALRFDVFTRKTHVRTASVAPVCVLVLRRKKPCLEDPIDFISPKQVRPVVDEFSIVIEPQDRRRLTVQEAIDDLSVWPRLMWGGPRDWQLLGKLSRHPTFGTLRRGTSVKSRQGVTFGDRKKPAPHYEEKRMFDEKRIAERRTWLFDPGDFDVVRDVRVHSRASTNMEAFSWPQLILRQSWNRSSGRFHAWLSVSADKTGVLCNQSYVSVHAEEAVLQAATVAHNSKVAVYYHFLTSGRFAAYRPKLAKDEIMGLPIPIPGPGLLSGVENYRQLDERAFELFDLKDAERVLIEDAIEYTLGDYLGSDKSSGHERTSDEDGTEEEFHLRSYCTYLLRVLTAGFGGDRGASATIFRCAPERMPYRLVAVSLGGDAGNEVNVRDVTSEALLEELERLGQRAAAGRSHNERVFRVYEVNNGVPTIFLLKRDEKRLWTRSMGLHDGDQIALDLFVWQQETGLQGSKVEP